ncbi:ADM_collapsed_G0007440.mRNA.1.CDS.1 [Saccharomyces cerevisiae]|nr:ADM_collapsed_G0007440.mRNA.1.CDS.1 [Saccharomyces cerevisiae]CAI7062474.1 ASB_collapsed_G0007570.mRNA.1.CDS.1 [Saccharomyces cerevisiae]
MLPRSALARSLQLQRGVAARFYSEGSTGTPRGSGSEDSFVKKGKGHGRLLR